MTLVSTILGSIVGFIAGVFRWFGADPTAYWISQKGGSLVNSIYDIEYGINSTFSWIVSFVADPIGGPLWFIAKIFYGIEAAFNGVADPGLGASRWADGIIREYRSQASDLRNSEAKHTLYEIKETNTKLTIDISGIYDVIAEFYGIAAGGFQIVDAFLNPIGGAWHYFWSGPAAISGAGGMVFHYLGALSPIEAASAFVGFLLLLISPIMFWRSYVKVKRNPVVTPTFGLIFLFYPMANVEGTFLMMAVGGIFAIWGLFEDRGRTFVYGVVGFVTGVIGFLFEIGLGFTDVVLLLILVWYVGMWFLRKVNYVENRVVPQIAKDKFLAMGAK